jgi:Flp pilus assembly pilin Flp
MQTHWRPLALRGQGMVEYALLLALIAILVIVALQFLQPAVSSTLNTISNSLSPNASGSSGPILGNRPLLVAVSRYPC